MNKATWNTPTLNVLGSIEELTQMPNGNPPGKTVGGNDAYSLRGGSDGESITGS